MNTRYVQVIDAVPTEVFEKQISTFENVVETVCRPTCDDSEIDDLEELLNMLDDLWLIRHRRMGP